jgi:iron complex transport system substrate-binding protein
MIKLHSLILILVWVFILSACTPAPTPEPTPTAAPTEAATPSTISVTDSTGKTITLTEPAQRIVTLSPASTETLFALGAGAQIVGRDTFSDYPEQAKDIPDIGGGFGELNIEAILARNPELILASALTPPDLNKAFVDAGL